MQMRHTNRIAKYLAKAVGDGLPTTMRLNTLHRSFIGGGDLCNGG